MVFRRPATADKDAPTDLKPEAPTHNIGPVLLSFVERVERLTEEKEALQADIKEVWSEAKAVGLDTKILRKIVQLRKMDAADLQELDAMLDLYREAIAKAEKQQFQASEAKGE